MPDEPPATANVNGDDPTPLVGDIDQDPVTQTLKQGRFVIVSLNAALQPDSVAVVNNYALRQEAALNREHGQLSRAEKLEKQAAEPNLWLGPTAGPLFFWNWDGFDQGPFSRTVMDSLEFVGSHTLFTADSVDGWNRQGQLGDAPGVFIGVDRPIIKAVLRWYTDHGWGIVWPLAYRE